MVQARQKPIAASRKAHTPNTTLSTTATDGTHASSDTRIERLKKAPILAAKNLGPALIILGWMDNAFVNPFDTRASGLY